MIGRIWAFWSSKEKMWKFQEMCWNVIWWHMKRYELIQIVLMLFFILTCLCLFKETHGTCWDEHQGILLRSPTTWPGEDDSRSKVWGFFLAVLGKKERLTVKGFKKKAGRWKKSPTWRCGNHRHFFGKNLKGRTYDNFVAWMNVFHPCDKHEHRQGLSDDVAA